MKTSASTISGRPTAVRWKILIILALASFISYVLRTNFSFAAPEMMEDLGLSEIQWGWVLAAFTAGYAIFQFPGGILGDRFGPRRVLTVIASAAISLSRTAFKALPSVERTKLLMIHMPSTTVAKTTGRLAQSG